MAHEIEKASESIRGAVRSAFAGTSSLHRLSPDVGKLVIDEIVAELLRSPGCHRAFKLLGDRFTKDVLA